MTFESYLEGNVKLLELLYMCVFMYYMYTVEDEVKYSRLQGKMRRHLSHSLHWKALTW